MFEFDKFQKDLLEIERGLYRQAQVVTIDTNDASVPLNPTNGGDVPTGKEYKLSGTLLQLLAEYPDGSGATTIGSTAGRLLIRFNYPDAPPLVFSNVAGAGNLSVYQGIFKSFFVSRFALGQGKFYLLVGTGIGAGSSSGGPSSALTVTPY